MNIMTAFPNYPVAAVPAADGLQRDNQSRDLIRQPSPTEAAARERGLGQEGERSANRDNAQDTYQRPIANPNAQNPAAAAKRNDAKAEQRINGEADADDASADEVRAKGTDNNAVEAAEEKDSTEQDANAEDKPSAEEKREEQEQQEEIRQMEQRDREVRVHEQQHAAVGGQYAGSPSYSYERGPNGKSYVTDGEVSIDVSPVPNDPEATVQKMDQVRRAALAPAEPSSADRAVAAEATQRASQARAEMATEGVEQADAAAPANTSANTSTNNDAANDDSSVGQAVGQSFGEGSKQGQSSSIAGAQVAQETLKTIQERGNRIGNFYNNAVTASESRFAFTA